jgi:hypothetical protein
MRCLAKSPAERFQSGFELADALLEYLGAADAPDQRRAAWYARKSGSVVATS